MLKQVTALCLIIFICASTVSVAQTLDGSPYTPGKDANIDLYINSWKNSESRITHGSLVERDILTRGNHLKPPRKGAVLEYVKRFAHAALSPGTSTEPTRLKSEQEIFYILSGKGSIKAGRKKADLYSGICVLIPANREFTMTNTGDEPLTMYLICEPTPDGFKPKKNMAVTDENTSPIVSTTGHWCHIVKSLFGNNDGLATITGLITVAVDPMTIPHPHSHNGEFEEVWTAIKGTSLGWIGKQIRIQPPGTGYLIPPDGNTPHTNINTSKEQVKFLYFAVNKN
ncbi:MAG: cupin domain-containing protein [Candidatus Latescibacteria bacterium]|jgi:mannose-6-phosphate isomerase-like protein (cupin superfamily)|nr:cupin domain-containing protein [Candidatus Latescibacterota bacterium]